MQRGDRPGPLAGAKIEQRLADAQMVVAIRQAALALDRQVEILDPMDAIADIAALREEMNGEPVLEYDVEPCRAPIDPRTELADRCCRVMVAGVDQQPYPELRAFLFVRSAEQPIGEIGRMLALLHPYPRLQGPAADGVAPDRHPALKLERFQMKMADRIDRATGPAVAVERRLAPAFDQRRVGFREYEAAAERRIDRRNQQPVVAPGQRARHRSGRVTAQPVVQPPLAALRLNQVAADLAAEPDGARRLRLRRSRIGHYRSPYCASLDWRWVASRKPQA